MGEAPGSLGAVKRDGNRTATAAHRGPLGSGPISFAKVAALSWPVMASQAATPLLGLADIWAIGNSSRPLDIGAIALGAIIFSFLYWSFGFLRMGVAGLTAQALGAAGGNPAPEATASLARGGLLGLSLGLALILLQWPIGLVSLALLQGGADIEAGAEAYFAIRIWGAPATLVGFAIMGWLTGQGRTGLALLLSLWQNFANIALDVVFVLKLGWGVEGVAAGTLIAEVSAIGVGVLLIAKARRDDPRLQAPLLQAAVFDGAALARTLSVNRDIFIRTLCLVFAIAWFTNQSAVFGDATLAANQLLLQFIFFAGFALDGPAMAAESLVGQAIGARAPIALRSAIAKTGLFAVGAAILFSLAYAAFGPAFVALLTHSEEIQAAAAPFLGWASLSPLILAGPFLLDGVFIGALQGRILRNAMLVSFALYLAAWKLMTPLGPHGLWAAFALFFVARAATLGVALPVVLRQADARPAAVV